MTSGSLRLPATLTAWLLGWSMAFAATVSGGVSFVEVLRFHKAGGTEDLLGLRAIYTGPAGQITKALLQMPDDSPLVVTFVVRPRVGSFTTRITDDDTGWWVEMSNSYQVRADTLEDFFAKLSGEPQPPAFSSRITAQNGFGASIERVPDAEEVAEVIRALRQSAQLEELAKAVPESVRSRLVALNALSSSPFEGGDSWKVLGLEGNRLAQVVVHALVASSFVDHRQPKSEWSVRSERAQKWAEMRNPQLIDFVARFRSIGTDKAPLSEEEIRRYLGVNDIYETNRN